MEFGMIYIILWFQVVGAPNLAIAKAEVLCKAKRSFWPGSTYRIRVESDGRPYDPSEPTRVYHC